MGIGGPPNEGRCERLGTVSEGKGEKRVRRWTIMPTGSSLPTWDEPDGIHVLEAAPVREWLQRELNNAERERAAAEKRGNNLDAHYFAGQAVLARALLSTLQSEDERDEARSALTPGYIDGLKEALHEAERDRDTGWTQARLLDNALRASEERAEELAGKLVEEHRRRIEWHDRADAAEARVAQLETETRDYQRWLEASEARVARLTTIIGELTQHVNHAVNKLYEDERNQEPIAVGRYLADASNQARAALTDQSESARLQCSVCGERREPNEADWTCRKGGRSVPTDQPES